MPTIGYMFTFLFSKYLIKITRRPLPLPYCQFGCLDNRPEHDNPHQHYHRLSQALMTCEKIMPSRTVHFRANSYPTGNDYLTANSQFCFDKIEIYRVFRIDIDVLHMKFYEN